MSTKMMMYVSGAAIVLVILAYIFLCGGFSKRKKAVHAVHGTSKSMKNIFWLYKIFSQTPILKRYFQKLKSNLEISYPADEMSVKRKTTINFAKCLGVEILAIILVLIMGKGDWFFICMGLFISYFIFTYFLTSSQDKYNKKLLNQLGDFITNVRHHYSVQGSVEDAINDTLDETPYEMGLHASRIYKILTSTDVGREVDRYTDIAPNRFMLTFVAICATIKEYGDKKLEDGQSLFLTNINYLKEEINVEMLRQRRNDFMFSGLTVLSLLPLLFIKAIQSWGSSTIPEMSEFYTGTAGTCVMAGLFIVTVITYQLISNLKDGHATDEREHKILDWIMTIPLVNKLITININKNYTKNMRIDDSLKMVGDKIGVKKFLLKRITYGVLAILAINVIICTSEWRSKHNILNDFSESFESSIVPSEEYRNSMREIAQNYTNACKKMPDTQKNREAIQRQIVEQEEMPNDLAEEVTAEVFTRIVKFQHVYYQWWYLLINLIGFALGFYMPYWLLMYQIKVVKMDMEDEVIQYQTIALILMHVDGIMIDTVLEWMGRFAYCFKESIQECRLNLEYSTQKALLKMKNQESFPPFRRFVDNLLMVDDEDILTAFSEIETDREYHKEKRKEDNEEISTQKSEIGKIVAFIPLMATLAGYLIIPFGMYAVKMLEEFSNI